MDKRHSNFLLTLAGAIAATGAYYAFVRPKHLKWGATKEEAEGYLPIDELVPDAIHRSTHAITIDAPPEYVWPWLAQLGQDKAGFYSYSSLENLFGCQMKNTEEIRAEWQTLKLGDRVKFHPKVPTVPVRLLEKNRHIVLGEPNEFAWGFVTKPLDGNQTRLIIRSCAPSAKFLKRAIDIAFWEPAHFVMERKMMLTIKRLAEEWYQADLAAGIKIA